VFTTEERKQMKPLHERKEQQPLIWTHAKTFQRAFELRTAEDVYATLCWEQDWRSPARAEVAGDGWTFQRSGENHPYILVSRPGRAVEVARLDLTGPGTALLACREGQNYHWEYGTDEAGSVFGAWKSAEGQPILTFQAVSMLTADMGVAIASTWHDLPELSLLITLGWYLTRIHTEDDGRTTSGLFDGE
jgi:hypothetical protein